MIWDIHFKPTNTSLGYDRSDVGDKMVRAEIKRKISS